MSVEKFPGLKPLPVLAEIRTQKIPELRFSNQLNFPAIENEIRFNAYLVLGGTFRFGNCSFRSEGLLSQVKSNSEEQVRLSTLKAARLESQLPEASRLAKGRIKILGFTFGQTREQQQASKIKNRTRNRHNKEKKAAEKKVKQQEAKINQFTRKNSITSHQRGIFDHMIALEDLLVDFPKKVKHREFKKIKNEMKDHLNVLKLPFVKSRKIIGKNVHRFASRGRTPRAESRVLSIPFGSKIDSALGNFRSNVITLIPRYQEYINLVRGYQDRGQKISGLRDYQLQMDQVLARHRTEADEVAAVVQEANRKANLADDMKKDIKNYRLRMGELQGLVSRLLGINPFLEKVYVAEGPGVLYERVQQARNELAQLRAQQSDIDLTKDQMDRIKEQIANAQNSVSRLESKLELSINPSRRLMQEDVPRDIRAAVKRVNARNYDSTKVSEADRVIDELVLVLLGRKQASLNAVHWVNNENQQNAA